MLGPKGDPMHFCRGKQLGGAFWVSRSSVPHPDSQYTPWRVPRGCPGPRSRRGRRLQEFYKEA